MQSLNKKSKNSGSKSKNLVMTLKACPDAQSYYRVRLLGFGCDATNRDDPWIQKFVHQKWGVNKEKGYPVLEDEITCPVTSYVDVEGDRYHACKICDLANKYFINFKESGWKDKDACKKNKEFGRKYQCIIPVYVLNNPNWDGDNNKFKVIILNDKKYVQELRKKVDAALLKNQVFNGKNAVDLCLHVTNEEILVNEGQPNQYTFKKRTIDRAVFTTKPYDIPAITKEMCDAMEFDSTYYVSSTPAEIDAFYHKYCVVSNDDIPEDDTPIIPDEAPAKPAPAVSVSNDVPKADVPTNDLDDLLSDPDDLPATNESAEKSNDDVSAEDLIGDIDL